MIVNCLCVGLGGFAGSVLRYLLSLLRFDGIALPVVTLGINVIGSFAIMFLSGLFANQLQADERLALFLRVGLCGGFTTFSTFSMETLSLFERGDAALAVIYAALSCVLCVAAAFLGELASAALTVRP